MEIWLNKGNDKLRLPVLPEEFEVASSNMNERININAIGEINILGNEEVKEFEMESFFPAQEYYFVEYNGFPKPYECVEMIDKWRHSKEPARLIVTDTSINMEVGFDEFTYGERDGTGDVYYSLSLSEYKQIKVRVKAKKYEPPKKAKRPAPKPKKKSYTVKRGDNLWNISKRFTGNPMNYKKIAKENKIKNPNLIFPGQVIKI